MEPTRQISRREWQVVELLLQGKSNKFIALALGISQRTVEFHLRNIYTKCEVSSRVELILKLGTAPGEWKKGKLVSSTVDSQAGMSENRYGPATVQSIAQELIMKFLISKHTLCGTIAALLTGFCWMALLKHYGHMSTRSLAPWIAPIILALVAIGVITGLVAKRRGYRANRVFFTTAFGTGVGFISAIPLMGLVVYPLVKIGEALGLIQRAVLSTDLTSSFVIVGMILAWLLVGGLVSIAGLFVGSRRTQLPILRKTPEGQSA